jgi:hypothetical protein
MPELAPEDAVELAEMLQFLGDAESLARFVGVPDYGPASLREDFARFAFLLGATDGEDLFAPDER